MWKCISFFLLIYYELFFRLWRKDASSRFRAFLAGIPALERWGKCDKPYRVVRVEA